MASNKLLPFAGTAAYYQASVRGLETAVDLHAPARTVIAEGRVLTVPIAGGSRMLRHPVADLQLSQHGRWQEVHLGAWRAAYGRSPYFQHLFPELETVYARHSQGSLMEFNTAIDEIVTRWLDLPESFALLQQHRAENPDFFAEIGREHSTKINMGCSIFDALFRLGRNTIFGI